MNIQARLTMMVVVLAGWDVQESLAVGGVAVGVDHCGGCVCGGGGSEGRMGGEVVVFERE